MTNTDTDTPIKAHFAVAGLRIADKKYFLAMVVLTEEEVKAKQLLRLDALHPKSVESTALYKLYSEQLLKKLRYCRPGAVYEFATNETHANISYTRFQEPAFYLPVDSTLVVTWDAEHRAIQAHKRRRAKLDKDGKTRALHQHLQPVREAYDSLPYNARADLLAEVLAYVTRGV